MVDAKPISRGKRFQDLTGRRFGEWIVIRFGEKRKKLIYWLCRCPCGAESLVYSGNLTSGKSSRCETCRRRDCGVKPGMASKHPAEYRTWLGMRRRCYEESHIEYHRYGAIGIAVCEAWRCSFETFFADMGPRPSALHSIDRFPNGRGNYEPGNCRWATNKEQQRNKTNNHMLTLDGETKCLQEWAELKHLNYKTILNRLNYGWSAERAFDTPPRKITRSQGIAKPTKLWD